MTQEDLIAKYPRILGRVKYLEVDSGWYPLIDALCAHLRWHTEQRAAPQVVALQVKEKFGGLRFYIEGAASLEQRAVIDFTEHLSYSVCERCGSMVGVTTRGPGWIKTLCEEHQHERNEVVGSPGVAAPGCSRGDGDSPGVPGGGPGQLPGDAPPGGEPE